MKTKLFLLSLMATSFLLLGCDKDDKTGNEVGTLNFKVTFWNIEFPVDKKQGVTGKENVYTLPIVDMKNYVYKFEVSETELKEGASPEGIEWVTIFESDPNQMIYFSEIELSKDIQAGDYRSIRISGKYFGDFIWVCEFQGNKMYIIPDRDPDDDSIVWEHFTETGGFDIEDGVFVLGTDRERLGTFEIKANKTTNLIMRYNLKTLDWHDNDGSGDWSDGDDISNWTVPEGVTTMMDFIVEYE